MTRAKSTSAVAFLKPNSSAFLICDRTRADLMKAFDGTQPVFRQSPPMRCFSTSVTLARTVAAI